MNFLPTNARERWLLLLFPFKAYLFVSPAVFFVSIYLTIGDRIHGASQIAAGTIAIGYLGCLFAFVFASLFLFWIGWRKNAFTCALFALATFIVLLLWLPMLAQAKIR